MEIAATVVAKEFTSIVPVLHVRRGETVTSLEHQGLTTEDLKQLEQLAADKFAAAFKGGEQVRITISGKAKEIASLVLGLQGKLSEQITFTGRDASSEDRNKLADMVRSVLGEKSQGTCLQRQPYPTSPEQKQDEAHLPD